MQVYDCVKYKTIFYFSKGYKMGDWIYLVSVWTLLILLLIHIGVVFYHIRVIKRHRGEQKRIQEELEASYNAACETFAEISNELTGGLKQ